VSQIPLTPSVPAETPNFPEPAKESTFMSRLKSFRSKKHSQKADKDDVTSPPAPNGAEKDEAAEKTEEGATNGSSSRVKGKPYMFTDVLAIIRETYETALNAPEAPEKSEVASLNSISKIPVLEDGRLRSAIMPTIPDDTPVIQPSPDTIIIIAEQRVIVDGSMDLYRGTVGSIGNDIDLLENIAPGWLGELLLLVKSHLANLTNRINFRRKRSSKLVFFSNLILHRCCQRCRAGITLQDYADRRNPRLNANRLLRARKVIAYAAERIDSDHIPKDGKEHPDNWLELLCQEKVCTIEFED
jgi:WD repeat-containing protein 48